MFLYRSNSKMNDLSDLKRKALEARIAVLEMVYGASEGHIPSALSLVEILTVLYYKVLNINPEDPKNPDRDRFILSKGHGCCALYAILADLGFFPKDELDKFLTFEGILGGHPEMQKVPGIEVSTGSLGQGLSMAIGMAISAKLLSKQHKIYCVIGDGECNEGSIWEAAQAAPHFKLDNLVVIVDQNLHQSSGRVWDVIDPLDLAKKWESFGWSVINVGGHDMTHIYGVLQFIPLVVNRPTAVIARTIKGKGISFMEDQIKWHTSVPSREEYEVAMKELNGYKEVLG